MGPKKKGGGEGKKTGKASKLAKMNEQERTRYLERKMQEEEELKRRKEEMVNVFLKMTGSEKSFAFHENCSHKLNFYYNKLLYM